MRKKKIRWDEYVETPVVNFKSVVVIGWLRSLYDRLVRRFINDERGAYLKGTILDTPDTLGGWDKKLRRKK